jgi:7,8-dihydropterin-6-yl-methyl-4-(beta-D-ribofuranosyl)aminobenzene 5'-phosphate synthase
MQIQKNACQLTILVENTAYGRGLLGEHGLSYLIETDSQRILFDTGQGLTLRHNAQQLGISLQNLEAVALSHGHYDHTGGLMTLLEDCNIAKLFLHPAALQPKFSPRGNIGSPIQDADRLKQTIDQLVWTDKPTEVIPGMYLTGSIPRRHPLEDTGGDFWQDSQHNQVDLIVDDQALFLDTPAGMVVILGCAHSGVINTLNYIAQITGTDQFYAVIGGMHLNRASRDRAHATVETLTHYNVQLLGANHCTGTAAIAFLWHHFPGDCISCHVGTRLGFGT